VSKTYANGFHIIHAGDGLIQKSILPDVCKTPSPGGPVPVPYVNLARDGDLQDGSETVKIAGNPVAIAISNLGTSSGDEPGTAGGGIVSSKIKGKLTWANSSLDVKVEGEGVVRFLDATLHNGNKSNTTGVDDGSVTVGYGDDARENGICENCEEDVSTHRIEETPESRGRALELAGALSKQEHAGLRYDPEYGHHDGYMIGVLICKGKSQTIYAAMSGVIHDAFGKAVATLEGWLECGGLSEADVPRDKKIQFLKETQAPQHQKYKNKGYKDNQIIGLILKDLVYTNPRGDLVSASRLPHPKGPKPGSCVAPRLIQRAQSEGHVPGALTEIWYCPPAPEGINMGKTKVTIPSRWLDGVRIETPKDFGHLETVPSCPTCEIHLERMMCGAATKDCP
jgi:Domain of unknown function (DUF4150)